MKKITFLLFLFSIYSCKSYAAKDSIQTSNKLYDQILFVKHQNDSLSKRIDDIEKEDYKSTEVISTINDFYDRAWNKLIFFLSGAGTIILFVLPYLLAKNQEEKMELKVREFDNMTDKKINELEDKIRTFHSEQFNILKGELQLTQVDINQNLENEINHMQMYIFVLRGLISENEKDYDNFFKHYIIAATKLFGSTKTKDFESILKAIKQRIVKCVNENIEIDKVIKTRLDEFAKNTESNFGEQFEKEINDFKAKVASLKFK